MRNIGGQQVYSATDLVGFLECGHLAGLERAAASGHLDRPVRTDPVLDRIAQRGELHEARFLESLRAEGVAVSEIKPDPVLPADQRADQGRDATLAAMRDGAGAIYQAVLFDGRRLGYADFLRRVEESSPLGPWSYEVWDTKLARHAKASALLQLCMYSDILGALQGMPPAEMHLALGGVRGEQVSFHYSDYAAYYRMVAREFEATLDVSPVYPLTTTPAPVEHCEVCRWSLECRAHWRAADDLSLVAGLTARQRRVFQDIGVATRTGLAEPIDPLPEKLEGIGRDALERVRAQAHIQVRGERVGAMLSERIPPPRDREGALISNHGLLMLPKPSPGDLFLDLEGDPFFSSDEVDGIEYLFGIIEPSRTDAGGQPVFHAYWAIEGGTVTTHGERRAFEAFIDLVMNRLEADPSMHIYHYAPYEPTAVKRLAGRYGAREEEVDKLLRGEVFVDLHRAVRQGIRASVESYSIKRLEPLYRFERTVDLRDAGTSIVEFETWLELGQGGEREEIRAQIEGYNREDCLSALHLRDWLEEQRAALEKDLGEELPRPSAKAPEETEDSDAQKAVNELAAELIHGLPESLTEMSGDQHGRWLLAQLLNWHRRENKSFWWRYFYLSALTDEERREESDALGELIFECSWPDPAPRTRSTIYRFRFPPQEHDIRVDSSPHDPATGNSVGTVVHLDDDAGVIDIKRSNARSGPSPASLIPYEFVRPRPKPESLQRIARWVLEHGIDAPGEYRAARDLLVRLPPRFTYANGQPLRADGEGAEAAARRLVGAIDESYLAIQGPPGSGKSTAGARMIVDLVAEGRHVGVTANSHKVIGALLEKVAVVAEERGVAVCVGQRTDDEPTFDGAMPLSNDTARDALATGAVDIVGGTTWLWSREDMVKSVDVLFIDEAGQMSLADALAALPCAQSVVLLGDPQQLDQPLQGTHPPGAERSVLAHVLHGERVMPDELGLFLDGSWRLHPDISEYTSEAFYEGRLRSHPGRERLNVVGAAPLSGTGIRFVPVPHSGRSNEAPEEVDVAVRLVRSLLEAPPTYTDAEGVSRPLTEPDVLFIAPYNAQVRALSIALPGLRIGTVDKFQGQEAPISVYSMATSSLNEAPRGMEFLYSLNRLNVATSRAQCIALVVASPELLRVRCRTPRQMHLANALARLFEMAVSPD